MKTRLNGKTVFDINYSNIEEMERHGVSKTFWWNGKLKNSINYSHKIFNGELSTYYKSGKLRRKDYYVVGKFKKGNCYTKTGADTTHYEYKISVKYIGGILKMQEDINTNLMFPKKFSEYKNEGRVIVSFQIGKDGKVRNPKIVQSVSKECDAEVIRVINLLGDFEPQKIEGNVIVTNALLPITFHASGCRVQYSPTMYKLKSSISNNNFYQF